MIKHKIVFVGDTGVGKTSIIRKYLGLSDDVEPTVGAVSKNHKVRLESQEVTLSIWDTAGQDDFRCLIPMYARNSEAALIVYDQNNINSFISVKQWLEHMRNEIGVPCIFIIGNKYDLPENVDIAKVTEFAVREGVTLLRSSAKTGYGINEIFLTVAEHVKNISLEEKIVPTEEENIGTNQVSAEKKKNCC